MGKAILAASIALIVGVFTEAYLGSTGNFRGIGIMLSVAIIGGFIIYFNEKKNSNSRFMEKAILGPSITLVLGVFIEAFLGTKGDFRGIGIVLSIAILGGVIIYLNEKKNSSK